MKELVVHCRSCGSIHDESARHLNRFGNAIYDGQYEWVEEGEETPALDQRIWRREDNCPSIKSLARLKIETSITWKVGEEKLLLFLPALASVNGWNEHPEEIDDSAVVGCRLESILDHSDTKAIVQVMITSKIDLDEIPKYNEPIKYQRIVLSYLCYGGEVYWENKDYIYISSSAQGDLGAWQLIKKIKNRFLVILIGEWDFYQHYAYMTNIEVQRYELDEFFGKAQVL